MRSIAQFSYKVADDGYVVALAEVIIQHPRASDVSLIVKATHGKFPAHLNYRLLEATKIVAERGHINPSERQDVRAALYRIKEQLGVNHQEWVERTIKIVDDASFRR